MGLLPIEDLRDFTVKLVSGDNSNLDKKTKAELDTITASIRQLAGISSLSSKRKEKIFKTVDKALSFDDAWNDDIELSDSVIAALSFIKAGMKSNKFRVISGLNIPNEDFLNSNSALKLLQAAGYKEVIKPYGTVFELSHNNIAILDLVLQVFFIYQLNKY